MGGQTGWVRVHQHPEHRLHRVLSRLLSIRLRANGYDVNAVDGGQRALAAIAASRPDLVLTDLRMDGIDGMALFQEIQATYPGLPVIILTAHGTIPDAVAAVKRGVFGYLTKPYDAGELLFQIERALTLHGGAVASMAGVGQLWKGTAFPWRRALLIVAPFWVVAAFAALLGTKLDTGVPPVANMTGVFSGTLNLSGTAFERASRPSTTGSGAVSSAFTSPL